MDILSEILGAGLTRVIGLCPDGADLPLENPQVLKAARITVCCCWSAIRV